MPPGIGYPPPAGQGPDPRNSEFLMRLLEKLKMLGSEGIERGKEPLQQSLVGDPMQGVRSVGGEVYRGAQNAVGGIDDLLRKLFQKPPMGG